MEKNAVDELEHGRRQPFYQVLVDMAQSPSTLVAYVAEENVEVPEESDEVSSFSMCSATSSSNFAFMHIFQRCPYSSSLVCFSGVGRPSAGRSFWHAAFVV
jgi:hypothetical protein